MKHLKLSAAVVVALLATGQAYAADNNHFPRRQKPGNK